MHGGLFHALGRRGLMLCIAMTCLALVLPSCGKRRKAVYPVHGKVFDNQDKPAVGAMIVFHPSDGGNSDSNTATGTVQDDGSFSLTTYEKDDGAPEGDYVATIEWRPKGQGFGAPDGPDRLNGQLSNKANSKLRFKVGNQPDNVLEPIKLP